MSCLDELYEISAEKRPIHSWFGVAICEGVVGEIADD